MEKRGGTDGALRRERSKRCTTPNANSEFLVCLGKTRGPATRKHRGDGRHGRATFSGSKAGRPRKGGGHGAQVRVYLQGLRRPGGDAAPAAAIELGDQRTSPRDKVPCEMSRRSQSRSAQDRGRQGKTTEAREGTSRRRGKQPSPRDSETSKAVSPGETQAHTGGRQRAQVTGTAAGRGHPGKRARSSRACWVESEGTRSRSRSTRGEAPRARDQQRGRQEPTGPRLWLTCATTRGRSVRGGGQGANGPQGVSGADHETRRSEQGQGRTHGR